MALRDPKTGIERQKKPTIEINRPIIDRVFGFGGKRGISQWKRFLFLGKTPGRKTQPSGPQEAMECAMARWSKGKIELRVFINFIFN